MKKKIIIPISIVLCIALIGGAVFAFTKTSVSNTVANVISVGNIATIPWYDNYSEGYITADLSQNIYLRDQVVKEVFVNTGDTVDIGDQLLEYDSTLLELDADIKAIEIDSIDLQIKGANQELAELKKQVAISDSIIITNKRTLVTAPEESDTEDTGESENNKQEPLEELNYDVELIADNNGVCELLCTKDAVITKAFINKIRGYDAEGINKVGEGIIVTLKVEGQSSWIPWMILNGATMEEPSDEALDPTPLKEFEANGKKLSEAVEASEPEDPGFIEEVDPGDIDTGYTKDELNKLIMEKEQEIAKLQLDRKQAQMDYDNAKKKLDSATVVSTVKGTVTAVGNPDEGAAADGSPFLVVESQEGLYLTGTINELALDEVAIGDMVTADSWMTGMSYMATITEISEYPTDGYYFDTNPNATHYPFTAYIEDTQGLSNDDYVSISFSSESSTGDGNSIYIDKAFVRQERGVYYVLKENENERLEKQEIQTGIILYDSYIEIKSGLSVEDKITFPYGKTAKVGAKTQEITDIDVFN